jgi:hypothetical protein
LIASRVSVDYAARGSREILAARADEHVQEILGALYDYAESIAPTRR